MSEATSLDFSPSFYARFNVVEIAPAKMDEALAAGYYRNGNDMVTNAARFMGQSTVSNVMLRLPLEGFAFKKRHRKLLRVNNAQFTHRFEPFKVTAEMETLWQRYKSKVHNWGFIPSLEQHLLRGLPATSVGMWQLCVFEGEKLVAFTAFDLGVEGLASLEAAYDPDYGGYSLGFYTMLLEIQFCLDQHLRYYYPGFLPKDDPMFKYKLRPGELSFFRLIAHEWLPIAALTHGDWLYESVKSRLSALKTQLQSANYTVVDGISYCMHTPTKRPSLTASNIHLILPLEISGLQFLLFVTWDPVAEVYRAFEGQGMFPALTTPPNPSHFFYFVNQMNYFGQFSNPEDVVMLAEQFGAYHG